MFTGTVVSYVMPLNTELTIHSVLAQVGPVGPSSPYCIENGPPSCGRCQKKDPYPYSCNGGCTGDDYYRCGRCSHNSMGDNECDYNVRGTHTYDFFCPVTAHSTDPGGPGGYSCRGCFWGSADSTASFCSACFPASHLSSGEDDPQAFGQYDALGDTECCGDDSSEFDRSFSQDCARSGCNSNNNNLPFRTSYNQPNVCCNNRNDGIYNRQCYSPNLAYQLGQGHSEISENGIERPNVYVDNMGTWYDCDDSSYACTTRCSNVINVNPPFDWDLNWTRGGESNAFGEYDRGSSTECCGDDSNEFWNYQSTGCKYEPGCDPNDRDDDNLDADLNDNWPLPYFNSDDAHSAEVCCNDDDDAVFQRTCYPEGPYKFTTLPVSSGLNTPNLVAEKGVWYDCDSDENTCTRSRSSGYCGLNWTKTGEYIECGEYAELPGTPVGPLGGGPAEPLHDTSILKECCGDDPGEIYANTSQGRQGSVERFEACCNSPNDCVDFDGDCVGHCQFSQDNDSFRIGLPNYSNYQCILGDWWPKISGNVTDVYGYAIQGAEVRVVGAYFRGGHVGTGNTDSAGEYYIYVPNGTYDVLASKRTGSNIFYGYEDTVFFSVDIQEPIRVDFVLRNRSTDCTEDCTKSDGLCHASCDGLSGCSNFIADCDLAAPGIIRNATSGEFFNCCNNATVPSRLPADVSVCGDNVVKFVRPVVLRGQFVNMILVVFEESPDC